MNFVLDFHFFDDVSLPMTENVEKKTNQLEQHLAYLAKGGFSLSFLP